MVSSRKMIQVTDDKVSEDMMMMKSEPEKHHHHLMIKTCSDCGTSRTPLWRGGPAGPKSLCNACGIRNRKQRRALIMGLGRATDEDKNSRSSQVNKDYSLNRRLLSLGKQVNMLQNSMANKKKQTQHLHQRRKLGEEEQAALLLMALSCGSSVFT